MFGQSATLDDAVANLVKRARAGDQNAIATIVKVRTNREKGNKKAAQTFAKLMAYVKGNPPRKANFGADSKTLAPFRKSDLLGIISSNDPVLIMACIVRVCRSGVNNCFHAACIALANGPALNALRVTELASALPSGSKETAFRFGVDYHQEAAGHAPPEFAGHAALGQVVGRARAIQLVRGGGPIAALNPEAAWELGDKRPMPPWNAMQLLGTGANLSAAMNNAAPATSDGGGGGSGGSDGGGNDGGGSDGGDPPPMQDENDGQDDNDDEGPSQDTVDALMSD